MLVAGDMQSRSCVGASSASPNWLFAFCVRRVRAVCSGPGRAANPRGPRHYRAARAGVRLGLRPHSALHRGLRWRGLWPRVAKNVEQIAVIPVIDHWLRNDMRERRAGGSGLHA
jgi:hypothetical protein